MDNLGALKLALAFAAEQAELVAGSEQILEKIREAKELAEAMGSAKGPVKEPAVSAMRAVVSIAVAWTLFGCAAWLLGEFPGGF